MAKIAEKLFVSKKKIHRNKFSELNIPILVLDGTWHEIMGNNRKTAKIISLEKKLAQLLKEQGKLNTDIKGYANIKKDMLSKIINLTPEVFDDHNQTAIEQMSKSQKYIIDINNKFDLIDKRLTNIENEIFKANHELFYESVKIIYSELNESKVRLQVVDSQIEKLRGMLKVRLEEKMELDELAHTTYTYLNKMLGPKFSNVLDAEFENE